MAANAPFINLIVLVVLFLPLVVAEYRLYAWFFKTANEHTNTGG